MSQGSVFGPLLFLLYIKDFTVDLKCSVELFADDTSLFTVVQDPNSAASDMNHDLSVIGKWAHDWWMSFSPDPQKQAIELILSTKRPETDHPMIFFSDTPLVKVEEHKHLGVILDRKLSFSAAIRKMRKYIGLLKYLSNYLPRHTVNRLTSSMSVPSLTMGMLFTISHPKCANLVSISLYQVQ